MSWLPARIAGVVAFVAATCLGLGIADADDADLEEGMKLYESLDYENAQSKLELALGHDDASASDIGRAALYLGLVHYNLGNTVAAETYFGVALTFDDSLALPSGTSPKIGDTFKQIRELRFPSPRVGEPGGEAVKPIDVAGTGPPRWGQEPAKPVETEKGFPWWTAAAGTLTAATGGAAVYFALKARATKNTIEDSPHARPELEALQDDLDTQSTVANLLFAATGAFAISTAIVYLVEKRSGSSVERKLSVGATATGSSAWVGASWQF